ncbi:hypothetical protein OROGR_013956 [Orobanche gracilis]
MKSCVIPEFGQGQKLEPRVWLLTGKIAEWPVEGIRKARQSRLKTGVTCHGRGVVFSQHRATKVRRRIEIMELPRDGRHDRSQIRQQWGLSVAAGESVGYIVRHPRYFLAEKCDRVLPLGEYSANGHTRRAGFETERDREIWKSKDRR